MKENFNMAAEKAGTLFDSTGSAPENVRGSVEDKTTDLQKKARKKEILEELKAKLGIRTDMKEKLLQGTDPVLKHTKDHVEVRTEQWVKDPGIISDKLLKDLEERTDHLPVKIKKSQPFKKGKEKTVGLKKKTRNKTKLVARKAAKKK